jgi:hypothetical protein
MMAGSAAKQCRRFEYYSVETKDSYICHSNSNRLVELNDSDFRPLVSLSDSILIRALIDHSNHIREQGLKKCPYNDADPKSGNLPVSIIPSYAKP